MEDLSSFVFGFLILLLSSIGLVINSLGLYILNRNKNMFNRLMMILCTSDISVVVCIALFYGLPNIWKEYKESVLPVISNFLVPIVHIAIMISVYCTVLISFERYVRIRYLCQMRSTRLVTEENIKYYKMVLLLLPVLFYIPKFFEVRWIYTTVHYNHTIDCSEVVRHAIAHLNDEASQDVEHTKYQLESCLTQAINTTTLVVEQSKPFYEIQPTKLRENLFYYKIYCVFLNTFLSSIFPMAALLYLNISTVYGLRKMTQQYEAIWKRGDNKRKLNYNKSLSFLSNGSTTKGAECEKGNSNLNRSSKNSEKAAKFASFIHSKCGRKSRSEDGLVPARLELKGAASHSVPDAEQGDEDNNERLRLELIMEQEAEDPQGCDKVTCLGLKDEENVIKTLAPEDNGPSRKCSNDIGSSARRPSNSSEGRKASLDVAQQRNQQPDVANNGQSNQDAALIPCEQAAVVVVTSRDRPEGAVQDTQCFTQLPAGVSCNRVQEQKLTRISISIVWLFIICNAWKSIPTLYEFMHSDNGLDLEVWPSWLVIIEHISHTLITFNSSVNFLIYVLS